MLTDYQKYQLEWMIEHGYSLEDLMLRMDDIVDGLYHYSDRPLPSEAMEEFEKLGFKQSEIWACDEESYDLKNLQEWNIIDFKDNVENLNTMDTFGNGFKIERDGKVFTLTSEEMSDFRYLDKALDGRSCLDCYNRIADENEQLAIEKMRDDEEICYNIEDNILNIVFRDIGNIESDVIMDYLKNYKKEGEKE